MLLLLQHVNDFNKIRSDGLLKQYLTLPLNFIQLAEPTLGGSRWTNMCCCIAEVEQSQWRSATALLQTTAQEVKLWETSKTGRQAGSTYMQAGSMFLIGDSSQHLLYPQHALLGKERAASLCNLYAQPIQSLHLHTNQIC